MKPIEKRIDIKENLISKAVLCNRCGEGYIMYESPKGTYDKCPYCNQSEGIPEEKMEALKKLMPDNLQGKLG